MDNRKGPEGNSDEKARAKRSDNWSSSGEEEAKAAAESTTAIRASYGRSSQQEEQERIRRRRALNTIHSRRKRERQKIEVEVLREQCAEFSAQNLKLFHENKRLKRLLELGKLAVRQHESQYGPYTAQSSPKGQTATASARGAAELSNLPQSHEQPNLLALQAMQLLLQQQQQHSLLPADRHVLTLPSVPQQQLAGIFSSTQPGATGTATLPNLHGNILDLAILGLSHRQQQQQQQQQPSPLEAAQPVISQDLQAIMRMQQQRSALLPVPSQDPQASMATTTQQQQQLLLQLLQLQGAPEQSILSLGQALLPQGTASSGQGQEWEQSRTMEAQPTVQEAVASSSHQYLPVIGQQQQQLALQQLLQSGATPAQILMLMGQQQVEPQGQALEKEHEEDDSDRKLPARQL